MTSRNIALRPCPRMFFEKHTIPKRVEQPTSVHLDGTAASPSGYTTFRVGSPGAPQSVCVLG
jgi:hypothetical protein